MKKIIGVSCGKDFQQKDQKKVEMEADKIARLARSLGFTVMVEIDNPASGDRA